jgi:hypothetical protein
MGETCFAEKKGAGYRSALFVHSFMAAFKLEPLFPGPNIDTDSLFL